MKKNLIIYLVVCIGFFHSNKIIAQFGFFGKNNVIDVNIRGNVPLINNFFQNVLDRQPLYKEKDGQLIKKKDWFNYGFSIQNFHYFKKNFGFGIEIGCDFQNMRGPNVFYDYDPISDYLNQTSIKHERLNIYTISFMPKIDLSSDFAALPSGLTHQFGFGYTLTSIAKKDYLVKNYMYGSNISQVGKDKLASIFKNRKYNGISILYQMNYRYALSKRLFLNLGLRYSLNASSLGAKYISSYDDEAIVDNIENEIKENIRRMRFSNIIQFTLGLGFSY